MKQITLPNFVESPQNSPIITIKNGYATTTSRNVAIVFGKPHNDVLKNIRQIIADSGDKLAAGNFSLCNYKGNNNKKCPMYELTRDGFTLLAMGFTGKRALEFKLAYINAFNEMERKLANSNQLTTVRPHTRKLPTVRTKREICLSDIDKVRIAVLIKTTINSELQDMLKKIHIAM